MKHLLGETVSRVAVLVERAARLRVRLFGITRTVPPPKTDRRRRCCYSRIPDPTTSVQDRADQGPGVANTPELARRRLDGKAVFAGVHDGRIRSATGRERPIEWCEREEACDVRSAQSRANSARDWRQGRHR